MKKIILVLILMFGILSISTAKEMGRNDIKFYGFVKLDMSFDDSLTNNPDAPMYVLSELVRTNEAQFALTAMNTRLGLKYRSMDTIDYEVLGNIEIDFLDSASDNSQKPRMRHAYLEIKKENCSLLAGQTWDIFAPLGPSTINTGAYMWLGGNVGFRRSQVRLTNNFLDGKIKSQVSFNRNIGDNNMGVNSGENSRLPLTQVRLSSDFFGVSYLYGEEKYKRADMTCYDTIERGASIDFKLNLTSILSIKGEIFSGSNLDSLLGGIGQGVNFLKEQAIDTQGGWLELSLKPNDKYKINICFGTDDPKDEDLNSSDMSKNSVLFANVLFNIAQDVTFGIEYINLETLYLNGIKGTDNRILASFIYKL